MPRGVNPGSCGGRDPRFWAGGSWGVVDNTIQYNTISFIEDDKNKDREVSADTAATETYYMMGINKI